MNNDERPVVWAVCEDEWENNGPVAVFTTQAIADEHCAALNAAGSANYDVRELPLLNAAPEEVTWHQRQICIRKSDGVVIRHRHSAHPGWDYECRDPFIEVVKANSPRDEDYIITAHATSDEAASAACEAELARRTVAS